MSSTDPYDRSARLYDRLVEPMQAGVRRVAVDVVPPEAGWRVLDVGCGTGTGFAAYRAAGCEVVGVDLSESMLDVAKSRLGEDAELHLTDGDVLPFDDRSFDLVTTSMVLHEVPGEDRAGFLSEMSRVANGPVLIVDFHFGSLRGWRGPLFRAISTVIERFSGHWSGFRSYRDSAGLAGSLTGTDLEIEREKIVAGGNVVISVLQRRE